MCPVDHKSRNSVNVTERQVLVLYLQRSPNQRKPRLDLATRILCSWDTQLTGHRSGIIRLGGVRVDLLCHTHQAGVLRHQVGAYFLGVEELSPEFAQHANVTEGPYLDEEDDEGVSKTVVYRHEKGPVRAVIEVPQVNVIVIFLHDEASLLGEFRSILTVEFVLGEVGLSLEDFWILSATWEDDVVSPRRPLPRVPRRKACGLTPLVEVIEQAVLRLALRHPGEHSDSALIRQRRAEVLTPSRALVSTCLDHQHPVQALTHQFLGVSSRFPHHLGTPGGDDVQRTRVGVLDELDSVLVDTHSTHVVVDDAEFFLGINVLRTDYPTIGRTTGHRTRRQNPCSHLVTTEHGLTPTPTTTDHLEPCTVVMEVSLTRVRSVPPDILEQLRLAQRWGSHQRLLR